MSSKIGRNEKCECGSGKKFTNCHLPILETGDLGLAIKPFNKRLDELEKRLHSSGSKGKKAISVIGSLRIQVDYIRAIYERLSYYSDERSELIKQQVEDIKTKGSIDGERHDQYHQVSINAGADLNNLFTSVKTTSNLLPHIFCDSFGHKFTRGVERKSFRTFINSLVKVRFDSEDAEKVRKAFIEYGLELEEINNKYRDKFIEHPEKPHLYKSLSSKGGEVGFVHYDPDVPFQGDLEDLPPGGGDIFYIHLQPPKGLKVGDEIKRGDPMGTLVKDKEHYGKYGRHMHTFSSPGVNTDMIKMYEIEKESPSPFFVSLNIVEFSSLIVSGINELLSAD